MTRDLEGGGKRFPWKTNTREDDCFFGNHLALCRLPIAKTELTAKTGKAFIHSLIHLFMGYTVSAFQRLGVWAERVVITTDMYRIKYHNSAMYKHL